MKIKLLAVIVCIFIISCGKKEEKKIVQDNFTENTPVISVIESVEPDISEGNNAFLQGDFPQAIKYYTDGLNKNRAVAHYNIGVARYMMRDISAAEKSFKAAVEEDPSFDEAVMNLVAVLAEQEKSVEAEQYVSRIVKSSKSARVFVDMANLSLKNGNTAKAAYYYDKALAMDSKSQFILSNYGNFLISTGNIDQGADILYKLQDKDFAVYYNLAYLEWLRGDKSKAYENASHAAERNSGTMEGQSKLAELFRIMKRYTDEAETLRKLIEWSSAKEFRIRLIKSYLHSWNINKAEDEANYLIKDYPSDPEVAIVYYEILIARGKIDDGGNFIKSRFEADKSDLLRYYAIKHISLYERKTDTTAYYFKNANNSPYLNLAYTAYYLSKENVPAASASLAKVPESLSNDYYVYKTFLMFYENRYREAEKYALKIDETNPEYFWYNFAIAWNLRNAERIKDLIKEFENDSIISARIPDFTYSLTPVPDDIGFTFRFDSKGNEIAGQLMYPLFIEPDEIYPFLALGYNLLKDNEKQAAVSELQKSIDYSDAVEKNNNGVVKMLNFDYYGAIKDFHAAEPKMEMNPFLHYNIGLASFLSGDWKEAESRFSTAIKLNNLFSPAYLGLGLCKARFGLNDDASKNYSMAISTAIDYKAANYDNFVLPTITRARYLTYIAQSNYSLLLSELEGESNPDSFIKGVKSVGSYMITQDPASLASMNDAPFYKSPEVYYLMRLNSIKLDEYKEEPDKDINTLMSAKYITAVRNRTFNEQFLENHMTNKTALTDIANIATLLGNSELGLKYLRRLSNLDPTFPLQYKASLYFFMWNKDFINAEASYTTLNRLEYTDKEVEYYMVLYFLINYNSRRLNIYLNEYSSKYPDDYRGKVALLLSDLKESNSMGFMAKLTYLINNNPFIMDKVSIQINIKRF